jgi:hypothetical protein
MVIEPFEQLRLMEVMRLDEMLAGLYGSAMAGDVAAVDRVLSIMARRARLLGLDAVPVRFASDAYDPFDPPKVRVEVTSDPDHEHVRRLEERLRFLQADRPTVN